MPDRIVLDASIALSWAVDQPIASIAAEVRRFLLGGGKAVVPFLWHLEVANVLAMALRRAAASAADVETALAALESIAARGMETIPDAIPIRHALSLARAHGLSAYDSVYLDLAQREGLPLATLDKQLREAAEKAGVSLIK